MNLREEFEKEYLESTGNTDLWLNSNDRNGEYIYPHAKMCWEFYQAGFKLGAKSLTAEDEGDKK